MTVKELAKIAFNLRVLQDRAKLIDSSCDGDRLYLEQIVEETEFDNIIQSILGGVQVKKDKK